MPQKTQKIKPVGHHLALYTNNLGYSIKTYAGHLTLYSNDLTFSEKSCYGSLLKDNKRLQHELGDFMKDVDGADDADNTAVLKYRQ